MILPVIFPAGEHQLIGGFPIFGMKQCMMTQKPLSHIFAGLIIAGVLIIYSMVITFRGLSGNKTLGFLSLMILLLAVAGFVFLYGRSEQFSLSFGQLFSYGFRTTAVATLVTIAFLVLFYLIFPEYKDQMFEVSREQMQLQGNLSEDQIEQGLSVMKRFFWPIVIGGALFNNLVVGAIGSLIGAGISPKGERRPFE
jgi:hypothetical protein